MFVHPTHKRNTAGFTLIELLVVATIIGILASLVLGYLGTAREKAQDTNRHVAIKELQKALELSFYDTGSYPVTNWVCSYESNWENGSLGNSLQTYMPTLPRDPRGNGSPSYSGGFSYCYISWGGGDAGSWYILTYRIGHQDNSADTIEVSNCNNTTYNYGGLDGYILTRGGDCIYGN